MRKKSTDPAKKRSVSFPASVYAMMLARMEKLGMTSESEYLQKLVRADCYRGGALSIPAVNEVEAKGLLQSDIFPSARVAEEPTPPRADPPSESQSA